MYYFVELNEGKAKLLEKIVENDFSNKKNRIFITSDDCNKKLEDLASYLSDPNNKNYRVLAFIDPKGMQVLYKSLEAFSNIKGVDLWILLPTGIGSNRLLTKGRLREEWKDRLKSHLGISEHEIQEKFYKVQGNLFDPEGTLVKESDAIKKLIELYRKKLGNIWKYVSEPFAMNNTKIQSCFIFY